MSAKSKGRPAGGNIVRPSIGNSSLFEVPDDAVEGYQNRIETGIPWTLIETAAAHHKKQCLRPVISEKPFSQALAEKIQNSYLNDFLCDESNLSIEEQWDILNISVWDNEKFANDEEKVCFLNKNSITDNLEKLIYKAVKKKDRNILKEDLKKIAVLRVNDCKMTTLDKGLKKFKHVVVLNLCGNYLKELDCLMLPKGLMVLELSANAISDISPFVDKLPATLSYLGLARNILHNDSLRGIEQLSTNLNTIDFSDNDIYDLEAVVKPLQHITMLTSLTLAGNPCAVCAAYARTVLTWLPQLKWLDNREIYPSQPTDFSDELHPDDLRSAFFYFSVFRVVSLPPPPKLEKGATQTFHIELEIPLLDSVRRNFLMYRNHESLIEMLPTPEDYIAYTPPKDLKSLERSTKSETETGEEVSVETDVYAELVRKNSREIIHYTVFESARVGWNKIISFPDPAVRIFCSDLTALRNTFRTTLTLRLVYTQVIVAKHAGKSATKRASLERMAGAGEFRVVLATIKCDLQRPDWSQPYQHFHWDDTLETNEAMHWGDGDLSVIQYTQQTQRAGTPKSNTVVFPENLTCHFGFGIEMLPVNNS